MHELRSLVDAYAVAADDRDGDAFADLFAADGWLDVRGHRVAGREALAAIPGKLGRYDLTLHLVSTHHATVDGDLGEGTAYCEAHHRTGEEDKVQFIRYRDAYVRESGRWRFASRTLEVLWEERR